MSWNYDMSLSASKDKVRFLVGDINTNDQQVSDEEIAGILTLVPNVYLAAAEVALAIAAKWTTQAAETEPDQFRQLARVLRQRGQILGMTAYFGGTSLADIEAVNDDTDRPANYFSAGMMDNGFTSPDGDDG